MTAPGGQHELLVQSRSDVAALELLYRELAPEILQWFRARVSDGEVARDLLAETFAQVICSVGRYRGADDTAAVGWVWGIARNLLRRFYRNQRVEARARQRLGITHYQPDSPETPEERGRADLAVGARLHAALGELPAGTRESVWLRVVDELSYEEIATRQGCSRSAARKRVSRGMRTLAVVLEGMR
jgi:RNA polymerase sigma factor (sigma-70 family)